MADEFDPIIAKTVIIPIGEDEDFEDESWYAFDFEVSTILVNLGKDVDNNLVCVTSNNIKESDYCLLFPTTTIGMARLLAKLINIVYSTVSTEEWTALLADLE